jgi:hypothetical protein
MNSINYTYCNNGVFPFRIIKRRSSSRVENVFVDEETGEEIVQLTKSAERSLENLSKGFKTAGVSNATRRKIAKHCQVLGLASKENRVRNSKGEYKTFRCMFITLTLPSVQVHDDNLVTKKVLGTFLDKCRKLGLLSNYVWRAEKQKNGNIHYHILTDSFANYSLFRRIWYLALRSEGYMQAYHDKFSNMSFEEYRSADFNKNRDLNSITNAYAHGKRCNWSEPPACHTTEIDDLSAVSKYVSKYISKDNADNPNIVEGRCWGASQSVSQSVKSFCMDAEFSKNWYNAGAEIMRRKLIVTDFFSMCLFRITSLRAWFPEVNDTMEKIFSKFFVPCSYWRNSVGLLQF